LEADNSVQSVVQQGLDHPEAYYRGHKAATFHAVGDVRDDKPVELTGFDHDGLHPPAGPRLRAFVRAFRQVNLPALQWVEGCLRQGGHLSEKVLPDFQDRVFGSITVQHLIAPGQGAPPRPEAGLVLDWHHDSGASALHLALSLSGQRLLRVRHHANAPGRQGEFATVVLDGAVASAVAAKTASQRQLLQLRTDQLHQQRGDVYLTSPSAFAHANYRTSRFGEALALQFRIAVPPAQMSALDRPPSQLDRGVAAVIADALLTRSWRLPTMAEVHGQL